MTADVIPHFSASSWGHIPVSGNFQISVSDVNIQRFNTGVTTPH